MWDLAKSDKNPRLFIIFLKENEQQPDRPSPPLLPQEPAHETDPDHLMVFLIQNTQNRDSEAIQVKLDDVGAFGDADQFNALLDIEELDNDKLERVRKDYEDLAAKARDELEKGHGDTNRPKV